MGPDKWYAFKPVIVAAGTYEVTTLWRYTDLFVIIHLSIIHLERFDYTGDLTASCVWTVSIDWLIAHRVLLNFDWVTELVMSTDDCTWTILW